MREWQEEDRERKRERKGERQTNRQTPVAFPDIVLLLQQTPSSCFSFTYSFIFLSHFFNSAKNEAKLSELTSTTSD